MIPSYDPTLSEKKKRTAQMLFKYMCRYFQYFAENIQSCSPSYTYEKLNFMQRMFDANFENWEDFNKYSREYVFDLMEKKQELFSGDITMDDLNS